tara:strand:- start:439928 stop:440662 length:735 start_codon:yes stop_codon:yes gene_type:complete
MPRPPFKRRNSGNANQKITKGDKNGRSRNNRFARFMPLRNVLIVLIGLSVFQYANNGKVTWHRGIVDSVSTTVQDYADRPEAGWRKASDKLEEIGAKRESPSHDSYDLRGRVVRVADGDTISVLDKDNKQHKIRLYGIDTPERSQPWGAESQQALAGLVANKSVGVIIIETDDYGRSVGIVYAEGKNVNEAMIRNGHAWWYQYYAPNEKHLADAQQNARAQQRGLWQAEDPMAPWQWRREQQRQ